MYHNKTELASKLYSIINDMQLEDDKVSININNLLNPQQKYSLVMQLINELPVTDFEAVLNFQRTFKCEQETTHVVKDFKHSALRFRLVLEEVLELGYSLGLPNTFIYATFLHLLEEVRRKELKPTLTNVADSLADILFITYGSFFTFNLEDVQHSIMKEVTKSNNTKYLVKEDKQALKSSIEALRNKGKDPISELINDKIIIIKDRNTNKILKPITFKEPDIDTIVSADLLKKSNENE